MTDTSKHEPKSTGAEVTIEDHAGGFLEFIRDADAVSVHTVNSMGYHDTAKFPADAVRLALGVTLRIANDPYFGTVLKFCSIISPPEIIFAFWPVRCFDGRWAWMRPVWRRLALIKPHLERTSDEPWWQYALPVVGDAR